MAKIILSKPEDVRLKKRYKMPLSKSVSNRLIVLNYLYKLGIEGIEYSDAQDTRILQDILNNELGEVIDAQDAGTVMRFMTAVCATKNHPAKLIGKGRMYRRPIGGLVECLNRAGADILYQQTESFPPLEIRPAKMQAGDWWIDASLSSQYVSALMMIMPYLQDDTRLLLRGEVVSYPYIEMTTRLMQSIGWDISCSPNEVIYKTSSKKEVIDLRCPSDYSSLAFPILELACSTGEIRIEGLTAADGLQGDEQILNFCGYLSIDYEMVDDTLILKKTDDCPISNELPVFDFTDIPDLALPMVTALAVHHDSFFITGTDTLDLKESDRWEVLQDLVYTLGCKIFDHAVGYEIRRVQDKFEHVDIDDENDHRVVMTLASMHSIFETVTIHHPECVSKSYPQYWEYFNR